MKTKFSQSGMTLIEIMIAIGIGALLLSGVVTLMVNSKRAYNGQNDVAQLQENARYAFEFIANDLRMAGYFGCSGAIPLPPPGMVGTLAPLQARDNGLNNNGIHESDIIMVAYMDPSASAFAVEHDGRTGQTLDTTPIAVGNEFVATQPGTLSPGDVMVVADCGGNETHQVSAVDANGSKVTLLSQVSRNFNNGGQSFGAQMRPLRAVRYYIEQAMKPEDGWSLYRDTPPIQASPLLPNIAAPLVRSEENELIPGVQSMQLRYGLDIDGDLVPNQYVLAGAVTNWTQVVSVQVTLLLVSRDRKDQEISQNTFALDPALADFAPTDHRKRVAFTNTILLRNNLK